MTYGRLLAEVVEDVLVNQNEDVLPSAIQASKSDTFARVTVAIQSAAKVRLVPSSGSGFYINGGTALVANAVHVEDVALDIGRTWNVQTDDGGGMTVSILRIQELAR